MWMPLCYPNFVFVSFEMDSLNDFLSQSLFCFKDRGLPSSHSVYLEYPSVSHMEQFPMVESFILNCLFSLLHITICGVEAVSGRLRI